MKKRNHLLVAFLLSLSLVLPFFSAKETVVSAGALKESVQDLVPERSISSKQSRLEMEQRERFLAPDAEQVMMSSVDFTMEVSDVSIGLNERTKISLTFTKNPNQYVEGQLILVVEKDGKTYRNHLVLAEESPLVFTAEFYAYNEEVSGAYHVESIHFYDETYEHVYIHGNHTQEEIFTVEGTLGGYQPEMDILFDQNTYQPREEIGMQISVSDDVVDFNFASVVLHLDSDYSERLTMELTKTSEGKLEGKLSVDDFMKNGTYQIGSVYLEGPGYGLEIYQATEDGYDMDFLDYTEDFTSVFTVSGSSIDNTPPEILSFKVDQTSITLSEVATFTIEVTDDVSGVDELYVTLESEFGEFVYRFFYKTGENTYQAVFNPELDNVVEGTEFAIRQVTAIDHAGNAGIEFWLPKTVIEIVEYKNIHEISGENRYQTAIEISKLTNSSDTVILALGSDFPDALAAGPLAYALNAPILLSQQNRLSKSTLEEIARREATEVIILGGTSAISDAVRTSLSDIGVKEIRRISGTNRYRTSVAVGEELLRIQTLENSYIRREVVLANGNQFADALAAGSMASSGGLPILLTNGTDLHEEVERFLDEYRIDLVHVVGGPSVVNDKVTDALRDKGIEIMRYAGSNRYNTSVDLALKTYPHSDTVFVTNGNQFADALTAAPLAASINAPILLVAGDRLPKGIIDVLSDGSMPYLEYINVVGGDAAVSEDVKNDIFEIISTR